MTKPLTTRGAAFLGGLSLLTFASASAFAQDAATKTKVPAANKASAADVRPEKAAVPTVANAAMRGDLTTVRSLLLSKTNVNVAQGDGMTALHWAADRGDAVMAQLLIKNGAKVTATTRVGNYTPLHVAAQKGQAAVIKVLLAAGADANATTIGGSTALHYAAQSGSGEAVAELIAAKADPNARELEWGQTPLMYAAEANRPAAITALLKGKADPSIQTKAIDLTVAGAEDAAITKRRNDVMMSMLPERVRDSLKAEQAKAAAAAPAAGAPRAGRAGGAGGAAGAAGAGAAAGAAVPAPAAASAAPDPAVDPALALAANFARQRAPAVPTQYLTAAQIQEAIAAGRAYGDSVAKNPPPKAKGNGSDTTSDGNGNLSQGAFAGTVGGMGGLTALLHAVRQGNVEAAKALLDGGADINERAASDSSTPLLMATINGQLDLALELVKRGANVKLASTQNNTPLYSVLNTQWAPRSRYPQPQAIQNQKTTYLELMDALIKAGADVNVRLTKNLWYFGYSNCGNPNCGLEALDGTTPFWRAAYAVDVDAMKLLVANGADVNIPSFKAPVAGGRGGAGGAGGGRGGAGGGRGGAGGGRGGPPGAVGAAAGAATADGTPPAPQGGIVGGGRGAVKLDPATDSAAHAFPPGIGVYPIHAVAGVGYGNGFAGNAHRHATDGWMPAMKYVVEVLHGDVNQRDVNGYTPLHHAAARGDNEMILYLVSKGADPKAVALNGRTTVDMANGPVERLRPIPETIALLEKLGAKNSHHCVGC